MYQSFWSSQQPHKVDSVFKNSKTNLRQKETNLLKATEPVTGKARIWSMTSDSPVKTCNECVIICLWAVYKERCIKVNSQQQQKGLAFTKCKF